MTNSVLGVILIQILISGQIGSIQSAPLSSYLVSSFTPPDTDFNLPFNHIAINNITGDIYIGARERLYQLDSNLALKVTVDNGNCDTSDKDNKLLTTVVTHHIYKLITCGCQKGSSLCQTRNPVNISLDLIELADTPYIVAMGDVSMSTVGVVALGADFEEDEITKHGESLYFFIARSGGGAASAFRFISKYSLADLQSQQQIPANILTDDSTSSKHIISYEDFLFVFISRDEETYLGRICRDSPDQDFASYTEIKLECGHAGSQNVIQSAYIGPAGSELAKSMNISTEDGVLYAVFSSTSSYLCAYRMIDVEQTFEDAIFGCIQGTGTGIANSFISDDIHRGGSKCEKYANGELPQHPFRCTGRIPEEDSRNGYLLYKYVSATNPLSASPISTIPDVISTSIVTTVERHHTVAFVGDTQGYFYKVE
ncbi:plexin-B1-like [Lytechinus pictus]|uniref:plexin-B1-like n=1 Tax=Lytechinus pictus TaxID=7653 RepID=UPI0030B9F521